MTPGPAVDRFARLAARLSACFRKDRRLVLRMMAWRMALPLLRRTVPVRALVGWMSPRRPIGLSDAARRQRVDAIRYFIAQGGRLVVSTNCLERSLMLYRFLAEAGAAPRLVLGVTREDARVEGHAWVELDGEPLGDTTTGKFVPVMLFEAGTAVRSLREQCEHA